MSYLGNGGAAAVTGVWVVAGKQLKAVKKGTPRALREHLFHVEH